MKKITKKIIPEKDFERLDVFLTNNLNIKRSLVQKNITFGNVLVNKKIVKKNYQVKKGDIIELTDFIINDKIVVKEIKEDLNIIYEDKYFFVVFKEKNLVVYPGIGREKRSLLGILLSKYKGSLSTINPERPGIVHRLDKNTSGLIIIAKDNKTHKKFSDMFKERRINKIYYAILKGNLKNDYGEIKSPIAKSKKNPLKQIIDNSGKTAITKYEVIKRTTNLTLVKILLITGRTHQIRVHFQSIGHPLLGDEKYGGGAGDYFLCAKALSFIHPITQEDINIECDFPMDFKEKIKLFK